MVYNDLAQFYDWEHQAFRDDLPLYLGFARASSGPILDAACGTGRVLLALAAAGYSGTGIDSSEAMLALAREKVEDSPLARLTRLVHADLRTMELGERHGMGLVALGSFHHLLTTAEQRRALKQLAKQLATGASLILDLVNPSPDWLAAGDGTLVHQLTAPFPSPESPDLMTKLVARTLHFATQTEQALLIYERTSPEGAVTRRSCQMQTRLLFRYEAELLLSEAGFRLRDLYGDYGLEAYQGSSPRMILVAERR